MGGERERSKGQRKHGHPFGCNCMLQLLFAHVTCTHCVALLHQPSNAHHVIKKKNMHRSAGPSFLYMVAQPISIPNQAIHHHDSATAAAVRPTSYWVAMSPGPNKAHLYLDVGATEAEGQCACEEIFLQSYVGHFLLPPCMT